MLKAMGKDCGLAVHGMLTTCALVGTLPTSLEANPSSMFINTTASAPEYPTFSSPLATTIDDMSSLLNSILLTLSTPPITTTTFNINTI
jgi:hypothetical protein